MLGRSMLRRRWPAGRAGRALKRIKEQLRAVPDHGLGYGLLRYLNAETAAQLARTMCRPQLGFNYLGRFAAGGGGGLGGAAEAGCARRRRRSGDAACPMWSRSMR